MADQLRMTIYNNMVKKAGYQNSNSSNVGAGKANLNTKDEQLLLGLMGKSKAATTSSNVYSSKATYSSNNIGAKVAVGTSSANAAGKVMQKINLEDLAKKAPKKENTEVRKNNTAMTLEELASKCKKTTNLENNNNVGNKVKEASTSYGNNITVKSNVIGNVSSIESLIPKISLNSIGKSNSFLK
jgi:hypothetical protein